MSQSVAALQDFDPVYDRCGSRPVIRRCRFNVCFGPLCGLESDISRGPRSAISDIGALRPPGRGPCRRFPVPCYIGDFNHYPGGPFMRATRLVSLVVPLLVVPGLAAAQSRYFTYEREIDRPGHAYRVLETHNAADCSLACQAANSCRAWPYVKPRAPRRTGAAQRGW